MQIPLLTISSNLEREDLLKLVAVAYALENYCEIDEHDEDMCDFDGLIDSNDDLLIAIQNTLANVDRAFSDEEDYYDEDYDDEDYDEDYDDEDYDEENCSCDECVAISNRDKSLAYLREQGFDTSDLEN